MRRLAAAAARAGLALALLDIGVAFARDGARFVTFSDRGLFALSAAGLSSLALVALSACVALLAAALRRAPPSLRAWAVGLAGALVGGLAGVALFSGSGVRRLGLRPWGIALSALALAGCAAWAWRRRAALRAVLASRGARWSAGVAALFAYTAHATVLTRQYELLHGLASLACGALLAAALAPRASARRPWGALLAVAVGLAAVGLTARSNVLRSTLRQAAPSARFPAMLVGMALRDRVRAGAMGDGYIAGPHLPLTGVDLVLVTVDALRADRLTALGGRGRMPTLDALASRGVLFRRAYCTTPHTSYSLASLMMGTYARSVLALPGTARTHGTLASWLGAAGYVTAGFFPPAVFAVDGERFGALRGRRFDFATRVEGYADASARVREVERWLDARRAGERVFVWVHLFEPHEPYRAHAAHPYGASREARYDAECSASDDALAALRAAFDRRGRRAAWFVTADHGEEFGEHGGSFHGTSLYDEQVRVPLVIDAPGLPHAVVDEPVSLVDLAPTILGGVGLPRPPRLRGNNLGALVLRSGASTRAFAATGSLRMVTTARDKLVADLSDGTLELFDLAADPREARNLADRRAPRARALRGEIEAWEASHARVEAQPVDGEAAPVDDALPDVLNRAIQGDASVTRDVARLLGAGGYAVRRRAAHALGDLGSREAIITDALARELAAPDSALRREAGVSLALLSDPRGRDVSRAALATDARTPTRDEALRAAVGLSRLGDHGAVPVLSAWINHTGGSDARRDEAVDALRALNDPAALPAWVTLLDDVRLAPRAAEALAALGDARALDPLRAALATQRYPLSVRAILGALQALGAPDLAARVREGLVAVDPLPDVAALLAPLGEPGRRLAGSTLVRVVGPRPASYALRGGERGDRAAGYRRLYLSVSAAATARITVLPGVEVEVPAGEREVSVELPARFTGSALRLSATAPVTVRWIAAR
jgi:HEAT repeat protein